MERGKDRREGEESAGKGGGHRLVQELRLNAHKFYRYFRMSIERCDHLLEHIIRPTQGAGSGANTD